MRMLAWTALALAAVPLQARDIERWELTAPRVAVRFNAGLARDLGLRISPEGRADRDDYVAYEIGAEGRMVAEAPGSLFRTVEAGELRFTVAPALSWDGGSAALVGARLQPGAEPATFTITGADGSPLFFADHQHFSVDRKDRALRLFNLDLRLSADLARRLGQPRQAGLSVGVLEIAADAAIPAGSEERPLGACTNPDWGNPHNDVGLIAVSQVQQVALGGGVVAIAPSAILKNVGLTDVPWRQKFSSPGPPYNNDQHPFLVWNMYRIANGQLEQIGASGVKHAFLTLNTNCGCPSGNILWVNCEDTYGVSTNNSTGSLGPRSEITARTGVWQRCGSIFDPNCDNVQDGVPGFSGPADPRRLNVLETELQTPGAQYYFDSWYLVRDDVNIFNTQGYRRVGPSFSGSWNFSLLTALTAGTVVEAWVNPAAPGPNADYELTNTGEGLVTTAVRVTDLGSGQWRYDYVVMNHTFDRRFRSFAVPLPAGAAATNTSFHDPDRNAATDWTATSVPGVEVVWQAPNAAAAQDWGYLYRFSFQSNAGPSAAEGVQVRLTAQDAPGGDFPIPLMGPAPATASFVRGDFDSDGRTDILWRHEQSGENVLWYMNGANLVGGTFLTPAALTDTRWKMVGTHDFNGDLKNDILWRHDTAGENVAWFMNGSVLVSGTFLTPAALADTGWKMAGTGDFNGDSRPDIAWHHGSSGEVVLWYMNGVTLTGGTFTSPSALPDTNWRLVGVADFSSPLDGKPDFLWRNQISGSNLIWFMNGSVRTSESSTTPMMLADLGWKLVATGDYNLDLKNDFVWRHDATGENLIWFMNGATMLSGTLTNPSSFPDARWKIVGPR
jgi:hypothetical protein